MGGLMTANRKRLGLAATLPLPAADNLCQRPRIGQTLIAGTCGLSMKLTQRWSICGRRARKARRASEHTG